MISDFDDDTHYCLKCHSTIIGLDNYVNHRKTSCGKTLNHPEQITSKPPQLLQPEQDEPFALKADDFFSSLELQSSAKKSSNPTVGGKTFSGVLTRSKAYAVIHASSSSTSTGINNFLEQSKNEWIADHKNPDSDNTQNPSESKKLNHPIIPDYGDTEDESDEYDYEDEDSDYDDEYDNNAPPRSFTGGKWKPTSSPIQWLRPSSSNDDRDWNAPPPHHTGAKWKPQTATKPAEIPNEHPGGKWKSTSPKDTYDAPPPHFTGSKWTPSKMLSKNETKPKSKSADAEIPPSTTYVEDKWEYENEPPPEHTKGKWKPSSPFPIINQSAQDASHKSKPTSPGTNKDSPAPSYTQGKWKPPVQSYVDTNRSKTLIKTQGAEMSPFRKSSGTVQYWCGACNRRLASKIVYERHLKSELHFKRTLHDREFEDSSYLNINFLTSKETTIKSPECSVSAEETKDGEKEALHVKSRRKMFITCDVCKSRVNSQSMGKHLISHYHCRKGDINSDKSKEMILENIHGIILQSPYQCNPCKFYCNTQECFLQHWLSESHKDIAITSQTFFWCSVCKFQSENSDRMYHHLISREHADIISVINRSVPVIIKKISPIKCTTCGHQFLLNIQLRKHCEKEGHSHNLTCSDDYQSKYNCAECDEVLKSKIAYQRHQSLVHKKKIYICSVCSLNFNNLLQSKQHRNSAEHRYALLEKRQKKDSHKDPARTCYYCPERFPNILHLKEHLFNVHPEQNHSCPKCGKMFAIAQDLTVHIRSKSCSFDDSISKSQSCSQCLFKTDSNSELLFHQVLHGEPLLLYSENQDGTPEKPPMPQYKCPICEKFYVKSSLRCHLRLHTKERPYVCSLCSAGFVRKNNWVFHMKNHDRCNLRMLQRVNQSTELAERSYLCSTCGANFKKRSILQQHMTRHTGKSIKCTQDGCIFSARFPAELKAHLLTHSEEKPYNCEMCEYKGKTKQQLDRHMTMHQDTKKYSCPQCSFTSRLAAHLKRHLRVHTGAKPFVCPHCDYCCNNLENLRKHVLSTNKHPGKCIYECKFCHEENAFETNFAKDFKVHLLNNHPDTFISGREATTYIAGIYEAANDGTSIQREYAIEDHENNMEKVALQVEPETYNQFQDPIRITSTSTSTSHNVGSVLLTSVTTQDSSEHKIQDELFPMLIVSKDVICIENPSESWNIGGSYDVEETGSLVPFHSEGETLFHEHF